MYLRSIKAATFDRFSLNLIQDISLCNPIEVCPPKEPNNINPPMCLLGGERGDSKAFPRLQYYRVTEHLIQNK